MRWGTRFLLTSALLLLAACTRTVVVHQPAPDRQPRGSRPPPRTPPEPDRPAPPPADNPPPGRTYEVLIPPGHLPDPGECRVWIPGRAPGRQPRPRSRACTGIEAVAPAGSWIIYRRADDRRLVYIRLIDERRPGIVIRNRIFDADSWELLREEDPQDDRRGDDRPRQERPRDERPRDDRPQPPQGQPPPAQPPPVVQPPTGNRPPEPKPPESRPPEQRPLPRPEIIPPIPRDTTPPPQQPPPEQRPPENKPPEPPPPSNALTFKIPPGHLPEIGECRVWIERLPPGLQPKPKSRSCAGIASVAPAGSWILYRPSDDEKVVHVRLVDPRRAGVVIRIQIFDLDSKRLLREENP